MKASCSNIRPSRSRIAWQCLWLCVQCGGAAVAQPEVWQPVREALDADVFIQRATLQVWRYSTGTDDALLFEHTKGNVTVETQQAIWSASKWIAAAAILRQIELTPSLDLEDLVSQYLTYWPTDPADSRSRITLRHLLGFASGYTDVTQTWGYVLPAACLTGGIQQCARGVLELREHTHEPGTVIDYNSIHLTLAGAMVEAATGVPIDRIVRDNVFVPAGMASTRYTDHPFPFLAGGLLSTPADYQRFLSAYLGNRLFSSPQVLDKMMSDAHPAAGKDGIFTLLAARYGLGNWFECPALISPDPSQWSPECEQAQIHTSPGASGAYPLVDRRLGYYWYFGMDQGVGLGAAIGALFRETVKPLVDAAVVSTNESDADARRRNVLRVSGTEKERLQCLRKLIVKRSFDAFASHSSATRLRQLLQNCK